MNINRLIYVFTLIISFFFYMLYPPWISWYLFVLLLMLVPFDLFISLPGMLSKTVLLLVPNMLEINEDAVLTLITKHKNSYPVGCIIARMQATGDDFSVSFKLKCGVENDERREVTIDTSHSGVTVFEVKRLWVVSVLRLFSMPASIQRRGTVLVLPPPIRPANTSALQHGVHLKPKPGGGFSEEHDMRVYRPGDPIRSIHWKISAKYDSLIIREPLVPPPHSRLLHIMKWNSADERDLILGRLRWVSDHMLKWQMPFYVKLDDDITVVEINQDSDLIDYLHLVLDNTIVADDSTFLTNTKNRAIKSTVSPSRFSWIFRIEGGCDNRVNKKE